MTRLFHTAFSFLLLVLVAPVTASAQKKVSQKNIPAWVEPLAIDPSYKIDEREVNNGYQFLFLDEQVDLATQTSFRHTAKKIVNDVGVQSCSEIEISYDPSYQKLFVNMIHVIRDGKKINKLSLKDFKIIQRESELEAQIYDGSLTAYLSLSDIRKGDILEYSYILVGENPVFKGKYFDYFLTQFSLIVPEIRYRVLVPSARKINIKAHVLELAPKVSEQGGTTKYEWNFSCTKAVTEDANIPGWYSAYGYIELSEYRSWAEVVNWALPLYNINAPLSAPLKAKIKELGQSSDQEKQVLDVLHFVQDEIRYMGFEVGENSHQPNQPDKVFKQRFGDCKDKAYLMCRMLKELNIEAYPNLVNSYQTKAVADRLPSPFCFNHVTVSVLLKGKTYWFDATDSYQRGKLDKIQYPDYAKTLLIKPGTTAISDIQTQTIRKTLTHETFVVNDSVSPVILRVITTYEGASADQIRYAFSSQSHAEIEKNYLDFYKSIYDDVTIESKIDHNDDEEANIVKVYEEYRIKNMWKKEAGMDYKKMKVDPEAFFNGISPIENKTRTMPLYLAFPYNNDHIIEIKLPGAWPITAENNTVTDPHFKYSFTSISEGGGTIITLKYHIENLAGFVKPEDTKAYADNIDKVRELNIYEITWGDHDVNAPANTIASVGTKLHPNWVLILIAGIFITFYVQMALRLYKYDRMPQKEAEFAIGISGWLILVMLGLFATVLVNIYHIFEYGYMDQDVWDLSVTSGQIHPAFGFYLGTEFILKLGFIAFAVLLIVLFQQRRSSFPFLYIVFHVSNCVFLVFEAVASAVIIGTTDKYTEEHIIPLVWGIIWAGIWTAYMLTSWRVSETFVFTYDKSKEKRIEEPPVEQA